MSAVATSERQAVAAAARDYFEGWVDGDVERMRKALHPALAKRHLDEAEGADLRTTTAERMFELTSRGEGRVDGLDRTLDVDVVDLYRNIASVVVRSAVYHEYLQLVRTSDGWKIVNALWQSR